MAKRILVAALLMFSAGATAGPFGLDRGMTLAQIGGGPQQVAPGKYKIVNVPTPHSAFESYIVQVGPTTGLCWIKALGKTVNTSVYGIELKAHFDELKAKLTSTYGTPDTLDFLMPGSIWNEPKDWMMALRKKERTLGALWKKSSGTKLPDDMKSVALMAGALGGDKGYVAIEYSFTNESQCETELAKKEDSAL